MDDKWLRKSASSSSSQNLENTNIMIGMKAQFGKLPQLHLHPLETQKPNYYYYYPPGLLRQRRTGLRLRSDRPSRSARWPRNWRNSNHCGSTTAIPTKCLAQIMPGKISWHCRSTARTKKKRYAPLTGYNQIFHSPTCSHTSQPSLSKETESSK